MKFEYFTDQPVLKLTKGISVKADTELEYKSGKVEQSLRGLVLETVLYETGSNGMNSYKSKSCISISLNEGDVLLFDAERGYYLPGYPKVTVEQAVEDVTSLLKMRAVYESAGE